MPPFPSLGRDGSSPPPQGSRQEEAQVGELSLRGKGEGAMLPKLLAHPGHPVQFYSHPVLKEQYIQAPFVLQALLMGYSWYSKIISHLCSQSEGGRSQIVSNTAVVAQISQKRSVLSLGM